MGAGRCEKGSGKRFPEDSLAPGWQQWVGARAVCVARAGGAFGEPLGAGVTHSGGEWCCPTSEDGFGCWCDRPPSPAQMELGDLVLLVEG